MTHDTLETWEKWPVFGLVGAAGLNTAIWYVGSNMPAQVTALLPWLFVFGSVAAVMAIDGALVATIAGMRNGRATRWSTSAIGVAGVFTFFAALSAHGAIPVQWSNALHGLFALTFVTYSMHLAQPKQSNSSAHELEQLHLELEQLRSEAAQQTAQAVHWQTIAEQPPIVIAQQLEQAHAPALTDGHGETLLFGTRAVSVRALARAADKSPSTVAGWVKKASEEV